MSNWLYDNRWLVPLMLITGGIFTAIGSGVIFRNPRSALGLWLLISSAIIQAIAGVIWYFQPARWG